MFNIESLQGVYDVTSKTVYETGEVHEIKYCQKFAIEKCNEGYVVLHNGTDEETIDGKPLEGLNLFGNMVTKMTGPKRLLFSNEGELVDILNHEDIVKSFQKEVPQLIESFGSTDLVVQAAQLRSIRIGNKLMSIYFLKSLTFFRFLFWNEKNAKESLTVRHLHRANDSVRFYFDKKEDLLGYIHYETTKCDQVMAWNDLIGGKATLDFLYASDGLPSEVEFRAKVEVRNRGFIQYSEIMVRR